MRIRGNGLRHCVRLGKIREIESEFSRIGVCMAQLWPNEVFRKFKFQNRFKVQVQISKLGPLGPGGKIPAELTKSTALSTWVSTGGARPVWPGAPFQGLGCVLGLVSGSFRDLMVLI